ncbi:hypothetical protein PpSQ1_21525 [Pseudomonas putida]|nr:hypothetical protein PpSQ1_21525 [Pseudomonas putida]
MKSSLRQIQPEQASAKRATIGDLDSPPHAIALMQRSDARREIKAKPGAAALRIDALYIILLPLEHARRVARAVIIDAVTNCSFSSAMLINNACPA